LMLLAVSRLHLGSHTASLQWRADGRLHAEHQILEGSVCDAALLSASTGWAAIGIAWAYVIIWWFLADLAKTIVSKVRPAAGPAVAGRTTTYRRDTTPARCMYLAVAQHCNQS
jgi:hypothetical protein